MDAVVADLIKVGDYLRACELLNNLLNSKNISKQQAIYYLVTRSECFLKLGHFEAVVEDSRKVIKILDESSEESYGLKVRRQLIHALFTLKRFRETEVAVQEWVSLKDGPNQKEATKIMERLHKALSSNGNRTPLQSELLAFEAKLQTLSIQNDMLKAETGQGFPCTYCGVCFNTQTDLRVHCQGEDHQRMIMSDEGRDWKCRAPPRGFSAETYNLCQNWVETGVCRYGIQCVEAHGVEELTEWKMRFDYRRMKLEKALDTQLYGKSYVEELIDKLIQTTSPDKIMREKIPEVEDSCSNKLAISVSQKNSKQEWIFTLSTDKTLKALGLLLDTHRSYFRIDEILMESEVGRENIKIANPQEWILKGDDTPTNSIKKYYIKIICQADIYGTFRQSVVFDFNCELILVKHLCVDVIPFTEVEKINEIRKEIFSGNERWTNANCTVVPFKSSFKSHSSSYANLDTDWGKQLTGTYPCPQDDSTIVSQATIKEKRLTQNNYRGRMHELLWVEEIARFKKIAQYNINSKLRVIHSYLLAPNSMASSTAKYSSSGELFALLNLDQELSEDSPAGRLVLTSSTTVYFAPDTGEGELPKKVYEALIEDKGKSMIYLRLSAATVEDLNLENDHEFKCNIQFQLNRVPYCEWHFAIDKIHDFKLIFPDTYLEPNIPWTPARQWSDSFDSRLNLKQKEAIMAITTPLYINLPPVLVIGPFGTGKTFTLAQAIKDLMSQSDSRILICTQSNSAADLYVKDYLHPFVEEGHEEARPLRIYYHKRWVASVNETVQKYCLIKSNAHSRNFQLPTVDDILKHRIIVVTLSISMYLSTMDLPKGFFTHIFLDEAAQAMECEAIMPLTLANENTRIVLAGDHMQLSPELFCDFAKERNLHVSLLERLYDHYPANFPCKILLCENYRAHEAIIQFTSESFYDQKLVSSGKQPMHNMFYPLTFFTTRGEDVQDINSTAFYNNSEVYEIVERIQELIKLWPSSWGEFGDQSIGVMTPYSDQVMRIRSELKKKRLYNISVERVLNVQGKQFRAIFLSTVRTRRTCVSVKQGEDLDYGFLSNSKLLNTAITRAQSLVAVVGDPIALCSIGRCSKVWERFIQTCDENNSLFGITWLSIKNQLDGVELKKTYVLNPEAPEFIPRQAQHLYNTGYFLRFPIVPTQYPAAPVMNPRPASAPGPPQPLFLRPIHPTMYPVRPAIPPIQVNMPPIRNFPVIQPPTSLPQPPVDFNNTKIIHNEDNTLIQFLSNVHFPEMIKHQSNQNQCNLNDYINLLPQNTSLAQMLMLPFEQQEAWYHHLLEQKGIEAAKKFEFLIHTTTKREAEKPVLINHASTSYVQQIMPNLNYYNKPVNQLNLNQPVYFNVDNRVSNLVEKEIPLPLYKREPDVIREVKPIPPAPQTERQLIEQQWKQQINADFANLSVHNGDTVDDIMQHYNNRITYASVVRSQMKPPEESRINLNLSGINCANNLNGPRLYQHF